MGLLARRGDWELASERGLELAGWTIDAMDYAGTSASVMHRTVVTAIDDAAHGGLRCGRTHA